MYIHKHFSELISVYDINFVQHAETHEAYKGATIIYGRGGVPHIWVLERGNILRPPYCHDVQNYDPPYICDPLNCDPLPFHG